MYLHLHYIVIHLYISWGPTVLPRLILGILPGEVRVFTTEVPVSCSLAHDGPLQVEVADDATRTEVEILFDNFNQIGIGLPILNSTV